MFHSVTVVAPFELMLKQFIHTVLNLPKQIYLTQLAISNLLRKVVMTTSLIIEP